MNKKIELRRGCHDRYDEYPNTSEYASPPCYMHEVDPSYFGLAPSSDAAASQKLRDPRIIVKALAKMRAVYNDIAVECRKSWKSIRGLRETIGQYRPTQMEQLEAQRKGTIERR